MKIILYNLIILCALFGMISCSRTMQNEFIYQIVGTYETVGSNPVQFSFAINGDIISNAEIIGSIYQIKSPFDAIYIMYKNGIPEYFPISINGQNLYSTTVSFSNPKDVSFSNLVLFATRG